MYEKPTATGPKKHSAKYEKQKVIGKGAFGHAVLSRRRRDNKQVVLKVMRVRNEKYEEQIVNEIKILKHLKHINITAFFEAWKEGDKIYICMEYADCGNLKAAIQEQLQSTRTPFSEGVIRNWMLQLANALFYIHRVHILHRDLKSENIFLANEGHIIKLGDFGISKQLSSNVDYTKTTLGTPFYVSPEIVTRQPYNAKSDIWSAGVVMYELMTLRLPFVASNQRELFRVIRTGHKKPIRKQYTPELIDLVEQLLTVDVISRLSSRGMLLHPALRGPGDMIQMLPLETQPESNPESKTCQTVPQMPPPDSMMPVKRQPSPCSPCSPDSPLRHASSTVSSPTATESPTAPPPNFEKVQSTRSPSPSRRVEGATPKRIPQGKPNQLDAAEVINRRKPQDATRLDPTPRPQKRTPGNSPMRGPLCLFQVNTFGDDKRTPKKTLLGGKMRRCCIDAAITGALITALSPSLWPSIDVLRIPVNPQYAWIPIMFHPQSNMSKGAQQVDQRVHVTKAIHKVVISLAETLAEIDTKEVADVDFHFEDCMPLLTETLRQVYAKMSNKDCTISTQAEYLFQYLDETLGEDTVLTSLKVLEESPVGPLTTEVVRKLQAVLGIDNMHCVHLLLKLSKYLRKKTNY